MSRYVTAYSDMESEQVLHLDEFRDKAITWAYQRKHPASYKHLIVAIRILKVHTHTPIQTFIREKTHFNPQFLKLHTMCTCQCNNTAKLKFAVNKYLEKQLISANAWYNLCKQNASSGLLPQYTITSSQADHKTLTQT